MIEGLLIMGLSLIVLLGFANLVVDGFIKGIAHSAVDQGVRAGARADVDSVPACENRARQVLGNILSGPAGAGATLNCGENGEVVVAELHLALPSWSPLFPTANVTVTARARKEGA